MATSKTGTPADTEQWLAQLDPDDPSVKVRDGRWLRAVRAAADTAAQAADDLRTAVAVARANGESWATIGMVLGVTRQAAQQRFGDTPTAS